MSDVRRATRMGHSSVGVVLPISWARRMGVVAGTCLELVAGEDGSLTVRPAPAGARPTHIGAELPLSVPCPSCGVPIGASPEQPRGTTKGRFYGHARNLHAGLGAYVIGELADRWIRAVKVAARERGRAP